MEIQTLEPAVKLLHTRINKAKRRGSKTLSLGSLFRNLRKNTAFSFFGDYPLLGVAIDEMGKGGFAVRRDTVFAVMRNSKELKGLSQKKRIRLAEQLLSESPER